jgi:hypothetical protein
MGGGYIDQHLRVWNSILNDRAKREMLMAAALEDRKVVLCRVGVRVAPTDPSAGGGGDGAPEEITEAMITAGEEALLEVLGGTVEVFWSPRDLAVLVYRAMQAACRT